MVPLEYLSDKSIKLEESDTLRTDAPQDSFVLAAAAAVPRDPHRHDPRGFLVVRSYP